MGEEQFPDTPDQIKLTWGLMAVVVAFVILMSAIVVWIMTSLVRFNRDAANMIEWTSPTPLETLVFATVTPTAVTETPTKATVRPSLEATAGPMLVDATWTPDPSRKRYVRFLYWFVKPNRVAVGECIQLTWEIANAASLQLFRNDKLILDNAPPKKTLQDCPTKPGYAVYRMVGVNSAGESNFIQLQVKVDEAP